MRKDVNILDIAHYAGVSVSTVSRVLNKHPDVSAETRRKVLGVIEEYDYIPNNSARNLKRESMKAVGVIIKGFSNPFFLSMLTIIQEKLERDGYLMILHQVEPRENEVAAAASLCKEKKPRGLIFMGGYFKHSRTALSKLGVPFVMLTITMQDDMMDRESYSSVTIDDMMAAYDTTRYICENGHRELAVIGSNKNDISISRLRIEGFLKALGDNGLSADRKRIGYAGDFSFKGGYDATRALLERTKFTCLFCIADSIALGSMRAIHDAGLRIPEDISVVGFDGIEAGRYSIPSLATVKQPEAQMAHQSVEILLNRLRSGAPHEHMVFETRFLRGESFHPLPGDN